MKRNDIERCRNLRKNQTDAEKKLWSILRNRQLSGAKELKELGVKIIRFNNKEILTNVDGVFEVIRRVIEEKRDNSPHLNPLPRGERRKCKERGDLGIWDVRYGMCDLK